MIIGSVVFLVDVENQSVTMAVPQTIKFQFCYISITRKCDEPDEGRLIMFYPIQYL